MEPSSPRVSSDVTSTPKAHSPASTRCPLLSPISPDEGFSLSPPSCALTHTTNVWLSAADREAPDSGFGPSGSALSFAEASSGPLAPLSIEIPPPLSRDDAPSDREVMFAALDENFTRYLRYVGRARPKSGAKVGLPCLDIISALLDADASGFVLCSALLPLLSPCDLRRMRLVSSRWRHVVSRYSRSRWRHEEAGPDENACPVGACRGLCDAGEPDCAAKPSDAGTPTGYLRCGAMRRTQVSGTPPLEGAWGEGQRTPTLRERFQSASRALLSSEHLARCPSCSFPARISPQGRSTHCESRDGCGAVLCRACGYPQHGDKPCRRRISPTRDPPPATVSSPEKKLRRRLLKRLSRDL